MQTRRGRGTGGAIGRSTRTIVAVVALVVSLPVSAASAADPPTPAVVGGDEVSPPNTYPFAAALVNPAAADFQFCGGSLIAPSWVLSAAHCFTNPAGVQDTFAIDVDVLLGRHDLTTTAGTRHDVVNIIVHDNWAVGSNADHYLGDIALVQLAAPSTVSPVVPAVPGDAGLWAPGTTGTVLGWGSTNVNGSGSSDVLMQVTVPLHTTEACSGYWPDFFFPAEDLCAGGDGADSCDRDSGGPLIAPPSTPAPRQVGIVSFGGDPCGDPDKPGVYTLVASYIDWIEVKTGLSFSEPPIVEPNPVHTVGLVDPTQGYWSLYRSAGTLARQFFFGNPGDSPFMGDWNCDGIDTPGLFRESDAFVYLRNTNDAGPADIRFFFGDPGDQPIVGDFNGNGCDTLSIYRPSTQTFFIVNALGANDGGLGAADFSFVFGNPGDSPVSGDWDGDGVTEVGLHRESTGLFYWRNTLDAGNASGQIFFGDPADRFVAGDWGVVDTRDTPALFRPSGPTVFFRHTLTEGNADAQFGAGIAGWLPVSGYFGL